MRHVRSMSQPHLSPDGRSVLLTVTDSTADGAKNHLWLVDIKQNTARQLTWSEAGEKRGESQGKWMPDGDSILFLAHRGEHTQLYRLPMEGGEARAYDLKIAPPVDTSTLADAIPPRKEESSPAKIEPLPIDVQNYDPSPDGKWIAILAHDPETPGEKKAHDDKADAVWVDHDPHGSRLYLLDTDNEKMTVAGVPPDVHSIAWSRQGDRLMAVAGGMNNIGDLAPADTTWLVSVGDPAHPRQLKEFPATIQSGVWSEDAKRFYFLAQSTKDAPPGYHDLFVFTFADGSIQDMTPDFTGSLSHEMPLIDDGKILVPAEMGVHVGVLRIDSEKQEPVKFETVTVTQLNTNAKQNGWVWLGASSTQPMTLYYSEKLGHNEKPLNAPTLLPATWPQINSQVVSWKNEGQSIEGLLYLPPQAATHKVPLIVDVHGGPTGAFEDSYYPLVEYLLGQGWAVLRTNPRGSTGYGAAFAAANKNDLGGADYRDIMTGVDTVIARYPIDATKLGLMGYSYGGEMAGFVEGKTDRFKAIISGAPVIDQNSEYGTESGSWYDRWFYGKPWEHEADVWRQSPLAGASHAKTPFLLLQGESDTTDPLGQSLEMYRALRQMGVPVEMVQYPREDHGPLAGGIFGSPTPEPWHGFDGRQRIVKFFKTAFGE
ncbi:dipeptidyl aminopeptidase/acylaminoacyl peptidase [Silvibacterium bohemicum]|uniref:Dipeptidyl aminopeptidase/acylaminoacyl peptidase n=1 Tax=Silvibacterium bohemicum TaxID=1577686 RepID=A0A841JU35_9BACT|nr:prolyl oligopeptidase family serine peptidase [Silvibacterium bohemicum]MBB6142491.1 dipeptidyl aminopeptidase/acylaminoacyl peptidase [Silvibacterium bohemicum]